MGAILGTRIRGGRDGREEIRDRVRTTAAIVLDSRHDIERITPELALVSPDDAERARLLLPDRPWEMFLPPPPAPPEVLRLTPAPHVPALREPEAPSAALAAAALYAPAQKLSESVAVVAEPVAELSTEARVEAPVPRLEAAIPVAAEPRAPWRRRGELRYVRAVGATTICIIALIWAAGRTPVPGLVADTDAAFVPPPAVEAPKQQTGSKPAARTAGKAPRATRQAVEVPNAAGFIFSFGVAQIDRKRVTLRLATGCGAGGETPALSFRGTSFVYRGRLKGASVSAVVNGRLVRDDRLTLRLRLAGKQCPSGARQIVARLS